VRLVAKVKDIATMSELSRGVRLGGQIARWMLGRSNILALSPSLVHWFWKSREELDAPDILPAGRIVPAGSLPAVSAGIRSGMNEGPMSTR
jgi:hypothetical protein